MDFPKVLYEDEDFLAVYKPYGMLTHRTIRGEGDFLNSDFKESLTEWVVKLRPEIALVGDEPSLRPGVVHRLDKDTSGVIVFAKNQNSFLFLKNLFKNRAVNKKYIAIVYGEMDPKEGEINKPIGLKSGTTKRTVFIREAKMIKEAVTQYKTLKILKSENDIFSLVELKPLTGRTHQLRVHMAFVNHPIIGDVIYGGGDKRKKGASFFGESKLFLHAQSIEFLNKSGEKIKIEVDPPSYFQEALNRF